METQNSTSTTAAIASRTLASIAQLGTVPLTERTAATDATQAYNLLLRRRTTPFFPNLDLRAEVRLCAQYVANEDMSLAALALKIKGRRDKAKDFLAAWGVDWKSRQIFLNEEPQLSRAA